MPEQIPEPSQTLAFPGPVDIHEAMEQVRALPEFRLPDPDNPLSRLMNHPLLETLGRQVQEFKRQLDEALINFFSSLPAAHDARQDPTPFLTAFYMGLTLLGTMFFLMVFYLLLSYLRKKLQRRKQEIPPAIGVTRQGEVLRGAAYHNREASGHARAGRYAESVRQMYLATLCLFDEERYVPFDPSRTNLEYSRALSEKFVDEAEKRRQVTEAFRDISETFERLFYGKQVADQESCERCQKSFQGLSGQAPDSGGQAG